MSGPSVPPPRSGGSPPPSRGALGPEQAAKQQHKSTGSTALADMGGDRYRRPPPSSMRSDRRDKVRVPIRVGADPALPGRAVAGGFGNPLRVPKTIDPEARMHSTRWLVLSLLAWTLAPVGRAEAFCGFFVAGSNEKLTNNASQVAILRKGSKTALTMSNTYKG